MGAPALYDVEANREPGIGNVWGSMAWIAGLVLLSSILGFFLAVLAFLALFLPFRARATWAQCTGITVGMGLFMILIANAMSLNFPTGLLQTQMDLPWPIK